MRPAVAAGRSSCLRALRIIIGAAAFAGSPGLADARDYRWLSGAGPIVTLAERIPPPPGFVREQAPPGSWAQWLRGLPVRAADVPVKLHTGALKPNQAAHAAVVDIDIGTRDLQQCADAIMRLRAEWLFAIGRFGDIGFNYTNGARVPFSRWMRGERPRPDGARMTWTATGRTDASHKSLRTYMDQVFAYAGSASLERELKPVAVEVMRIGDVFIKGGFPGHAVLVVDMARNPASGEQRFLLLQSYMPAQDMHILKNPRASDGSAWYRMDFGSELVTPEWTFARQALRRWPQPP